MNTYQAVMLGMAAVGLLGTWIGFAIGGTRWVEAIKRDTAQKIADEVLERNRAEAQEAAARKVEIDQLRRDFEASQRSQDQNFGEVGHALRSFIEKVEKEMHAIEIWGRDNYVQKGEFERATDSIRADIKALGADIKSDIKELKADFAAKS